MTMLRLCAFFILLVLFSCSPFPDNNTENETITGNLTQPAGDTMAFVNAIVTNMQPVTGGSYTPLYGRDTLPVSVDNFWMDTYPVTNAQYQAFVTHFPQWRRSAIKDIFADDHYLSEWQNDTTPGPQLLPASPVTNVSWFAARSFCDCLGKRLPSLDEWEYVAMADDKIPDARRTEAYNAYILQQYEKPRTYAQPVGSTIKNYWGLYDLHGLVWEWTEDFSAVMITGESRKDGAEDPNLFCGGGSTGASDLMNYAAFMRYAFRGSLKANFNVRNLGFRCASDYNSTNESL